MKNLLLIWSLIISLFPLVCGAEDADITSDKNTEISENSGMPANIQPLDISLSEQERQQENSTDLMLTDQKDEIRDLSCDDENLRKQVENFIYKHINADKTDSVIERRQRVLLVQNLHTFKEIQQSEIKPEDGFKAQAVLMELRINQNREVSHICASTDNRYDKFSSIYLIIYPFADYYKVVVSNLVEVLPDFDSATFIYNW